MFVKNINYPNGYSNLCLYCKRKQEKEYRRRIKNHEEADTRRREYVVSSFEEGVQILLDRGYFAVRSEAVAYTKRCRQLK